MCIRSLPLVLLVAVMISPSLRSQNLVPNAGFEQGFTSWRPPLWTREANAGSARIVGTPTHGGDSALRIEFHGRQDWSFGSAAFVAVRAGDVYETRVWALASQLRSSAEFSVILYDSLRNVLDWSWGAARIDSSRSFRETRCRFLIPEGVAFIAPRFIGVDSCDLVLDDASLVRVDSAAAPRVCTLAGQGLTVQVTVPSFAMTLTAAQRSPLRCAPLAAFQVTAIDSSADSLTFSVVALADLLPMRIVLRVHDGALEIRIHADSARSMENAIAFPGRIAGSPQAQIILPRAEGLRIPVREISGFGDFAMYGYKATMSFVGVEDAGEGYLLASDDPWSSMVRFERAATDTLPAPQLYHLDAKRLFSHDRTCFLLPVGSGGYNEMCAWYRRRAEQRGLVRTFAEKRLTNPNIDRLRGAVDLWAMGSWMQKPSFIDTLVRMGIDRAIVSLGGGWWNTSNLTAIVDSINARGLLSSRYDIYTDVWPPEHPEWPWFRSEGYPGDIIVDSKGALQKGWMAYVNDTIPWQGFVACSSTHRGYAEKWISADLLKNRYNCRFIDVELAASLSECYAPAHPQTRREDAAARVALLDHVKNRFSLVTGSEEARDFAFPSVDFGEGTMSIYPPDNAGYDWSTPVDDPGTLFTKFNVNPAYRLPLRSLVYHDTHVATWYTGDGLSKAPAAWDDKVLFTVLYASMPLVMPPSQTYWQSNREHFLRSSHLTSAVFRSCGFARMVRHELVGGDPLLQRSDFDNGWSVLVNFSSTDRLDLGLPSKGFIATDGRDSVGIIFVLGKRLAFAKLADRLFVDSYGSSYPFCGIYSPGPLFLRLNDDGSFHLALLGAQRFVGMQPWNFPFPVHPQWGVRAIAEDRNEETYVANGSNGWLHMSVLTDAVFYRLTDRNATHADESTSPSRFAITCSPNPASDIVQLTASIPQRGWYRIDATDLLGRRVATIAEAISAQQSTSIRWDASSLARGAYRITLHTAQGTRVIQCILR